MRGELGRDEGARLYDQELGSVERFDLILLGLGPDGHVASLYPEQETLDEATRKAVGAEAKLEPFVDRITLTLPMLCHADEVLFLVTGADKADAARAHSRASRRGRHRAASCAPSKAGRSPCSTPRLQQALEPSSPARTCGGE